MTNHEREVEQGERELSDIQRETWENSGDKSDVFSEYADPQDLAGVSFYNESASVEIGTSDFSRTIDDVFGQFELEHPARFKITVEKL